MRVKMLVTRSEPPVEGGDGKTRHLMVGKEYDLDVEEATTLIKAGEAIDPTLEPKEVAPEHVERGHDRVGKAEDRPHRRVGRLK